MNYRGKIDGHDKWDVAVGGYAIATELSASPQHVFKVLY